MLASGRFAGMIVAPNDPVGISGAFEQVIEAGTPIATVLFPIGPELNTLEPQVPGITATVASPPVDGATWQAEAAAAYCADKDPCNIIIIIVSRPSPSTISGSRPSRGSLPSTPISRWWGSAKAGIRRIPR